MDDLPGHLLHKVLLEIDHRSLAMMCCTNRSLRSHIHDPYFKSEYSSRFGSGLLHISSFGSNYLSYNSESSSRSLEIKDILRKIHILGSCSGLLLLFIDDRLCVANPITKKFRFFNVPKFICFTGVFSRSGFVHWGNKNCIGFAVNQIDRSTKSFKVVHMVRTNRTRYIFEINSGNSWRRSKTTLTCEPSELIKNPVYLDGSLHWLRIDGSIIAFNLETEQARLVPTKFPERSFSKTLFAAGDDRLVFISATEEVIKFYALENILSDPKWVLAMQIRNGVMDVKRLGYWKVEAYDGKCLVLRGDRSCFNRLVHVYDLSANKWAVMGSVPPWCDANRDVFQFTPSPSTVVGLDQILACGDRRIASITSIMALIDGSSSEEVEQQLRKRSAEHNLLYEQSTKKRKRMV